MIIKKNRDNIFIFNEKNIYQTKLLLMKIDKFQKEYALFYSNL